MNFFKKNILYIAVGILVLVIIFVARKNRSKSKGNDATLPTTGTGSVFTYDPSKVDRNKQFGIGTRNSQEVAYLQTWINTYYKPITGTLSVDGNYGPKTAAAVTLAIPATNQISNTLNNMGI